MTTEAEPTEPPAPREIRLRDLRPGLDTVTIVGRVVTAQRRELTRTEDGKRRTVLSGLLSDGTATVRFTWWDPPGEEIDRGTVLRAVNVQIREFRGRAELSFSWKTRVGPASPAELPAVSDLEFPLRPAGEVVDGDDGFRLEVRVLGVRSKAVTIGSERRTLFEGRMADASGSVAFTAWSDFRLAAGETLRITGGYVRGFRGQPQVILDERATVTRAPGLALPPLAELQRPSRRKVVELESHIGGDLVRAEGVVVGLMPPSGLVYRCPTCGRSVQNGLCRLHGEVRGEPDLRARLVLDDGTGALTVQVGRPETERLLGRTLQDCLGSGAGQADPAKVEDDLFEGTFGRRFAVQGRATKDEFGVTLFPETIELLSAEPQRAIAELRRRLGGGRA